jgi:hypothetical protein
MTSHNITLGEEIIDCYLYYDFQYSFNYFYDDKDYSLFECVKTILLENEFFDWNNYKFLHKKYTSDYKLFFELFIKKSLLYFTFCPNNNDTNNIYNKYNKYIINDKYKELNIFVKYNFDISIKIINKLLKLDYDNINGKGLTYLTNDNYYNIKVGDYIINTNTICSEEDDDDDQKNIIYLYNCFYDYYNEDDRSEVSINYQLEMIKKRYELVKKLI